MIALLMLLFVGVAVAAAGQAITGRGFRLVAAPVLMLVCGHAEGLRVTLVIGLVVSVVMFLGERTRTRPRDMRGIAVSAVVTAPLWVLLVGLLSHDIAGRLAGLVVLGVVALSAMPWMREALVESVTRDRNRWRTLLGSRCPQIATGAASSAMFALGGVGGTPLALYGRANHWDLLRTRAASHGVAALTQLVVLLFLGFPDLRGANVAITLVAVAVGMIAGPLAGPRVTARLAHQVMWAAAAVLAAVLVVAGPQL